MLPPSFDQDIIYGYMSEAKLKQESESNESKCMKSQEVCCKMKHEMQEAPVSRFSPSWQKSFFCYHDACLPGFHQWHFFYVFQFFCIFHFLIFLKFLNFFDFFEFLRFFIFFVLPRRLFARFSPR